MDNQVSITVEEFANAIVAVRVPKKSLKAFFEALTAPGRKEKHAGWIQVCEHIRQAKNLPTLNKAWRKEAHTLFIENYVEIEKLVWEKVVQILRGSNKPPSGYTALLDALSNSDDDDAYAETSV